MSVDIVNDALKFYDHNNELYKNIKKKIKYVRHAPMNSTDVESVRLTFYDADQNELFTSRVEILGKYYNSIKTWVWGWSLPGINKSLTSIIRKVFLYGTDIDLNNNPANVLLKNELVTSRFRIEDDVQLDIHCAIASYLAKRPFVFAWKDLMFKEGEPTEVKSEFYEGETDVTFYTFIIDTPSI